MMDPIFKNKLSASQQLKIFGMFLLLVEIISILPLLMIALYNHPSADDYYYGILTAHAWIDTGSFLETLKAAFRTVQETYVNWQGTFSGIFLMSLQPSVFGESWYPVGTYIILGTYLTGFLFLGKTLFNRYLNKQKNHYLVICFTLFVFSIQLAPFPRQSYYWFNGSIYYTFFYGLELILFAFVLRMQKTQRRSKKIPLILLSVLLAFFIGGGNYVTALQAVLLLLFFFIYLISTKDKNKNLFPLVFLAVLVALGISILAPGNALRQAMIPGHPSIVEAILKSFFWAGVYICKWSSLYLVGLFLVLAPFIIDSVRYNTFTFQRPGLVLITSFLVFTASFAPPIYGLGKLPERVLNINYYLFVLLSSINIFYYTGWLLKQQIPIFTKECLQWMERKHIHSPLFFFITGSIVLLVAFAQHPDIAGKEAVQSLITGEAKQYDTESNIRLKLYLDKRKKNIVVNEYSVKPTLLFVNDIGTDANYWQNENAALFFRKEKIVLYETDLSLHNKFNNLI